MQPGEFLDARLSRISPKRPRRWLTGQRAVHGQAQPGLRALWRLRSADAAGRMVRPQMSLAARLLLDLGGVEQRGDDRRRADADRDAGLDQLVAALLVGACRSSLLSLMARSSMAFASRLGSRMSARFKPFPELKDEQAQAADPAVARGAVGLGGHRQDAGADGARAAPAAAGRAAGIDPVPDLHQGGGGGNGEPHRRAARGLGAAARTASSRRTSFALGEPNDPRTLRARAAAVRQGARLPGRPQDPDHPQLRPVAARGVSGRSRDRAGLPADRGPGRAGAGAAHAGRPDGRRREHAATRR